MTEKTPALYGALAAAFVTWSAANMAKTVADRAEEEARKALDDLIMAQLKSRPKLIVDMGDKRPGDDQASKLSGNYLILSSTMTPTGPQAHVEIVRK